MKTTKREAPTASPPLKWGRILILIAILGAVFVGFAWFLSAPPADKVQVFIQPVNATTGANIEGVSGVISWMLTDEELSPSFKFEGEPLSGTLTLDSEQYHDRRFLVIGVVELFGYAVDAMHVPDANSYMVNGTTVYQPSSLVDDSGTILIQLDTRERRGFTIRPDGSTLETITINLPIERKGDET